MDRPQAHLTGNPLQDVSRLSLVIDLDGTLVRGRTVVPGAVELIRQVGDRFVVVSNNSTHSIAELAAELASMGLEIPASKLILAGVTTVQRVAQDHVGARVLLIGSASLMQEAENAGVDLVNEAADVVLLGRDQAFSYEKLTLAANEIRRGAVLVVANPDTSHPGENGCLVPETGALMHGLVACATPRSVRVVGKPQPDLFLEALQRLDSAPSSTIVIGDNPETDGAGAARLGMPHVLVGSGSDRHVGDLFQLMDWLSGDEKALNAFPRWVSA